MPSYRVNRINEDVRRELCALLPRLKDPRVNNGFITVVRVEVTNDLSYATVYVSSLQGLESAKEAVVGLKNAAGYIRREVCNKEKMRLAPEFRFVADDSIEYSNKIYKIMDDIEAREAAVEQPEQHEQ